MTTSHSRQTSGTMHRAARLLSGRGHVFELSDELRSLQGELEHTSGGRVVGQPRHWPRQMAYASHWYSSRRAER